MENNFKRGNLYALTISNENEGRKLHLIDNLMHIVTTLLSYDQRLLLSNISSIVRERETFYLEYNNPPHPNEIISVSLMDNYTNPDEVISTMMLEAFLSMDEVTDGLLDTKGLTIHNIKVLLDKAIEKHNSFSGKTTTKFIQDFYRYQLRAFLSEKYEAPDVKDVLGGGISPHALLELLIKDMSEDELDKARSLIYGQVNP